MELAINIDYIIKRLSPIRYRVIEVDYTKQQLAISNCAPTK
jgi:hypothetical protein